MGFASELVITDDKEKDKWSCPICHDVVEDAVETPCEHLFCKQCISSVKNGCCPSCRATFSTQQIKPPHRIIRERLAELQMLCRRHSMGCEAIFDVASAAVLKHESECPYVEVPCPSTGCHVRFLRSDFANHLDRCEFVVNLCERCQTEVRRGDLKDHDCIKSLRKELNALKLLIERQHGQSQTQQSSTGNMASLLNIKSSDDGLFMVEEAAASFFVDAAMLEAIPLAETTITRCRGCGGRGRDLVQANGFCSHCFRKIPSA
eukprot:GILJ01001567.1.p1 GENE.GILJ01001567.1~~GILJ01001567.1.p1  ORF type:complete len:262 (-),score=12.80 GILJ01001567.1:74-859(-)